MNLFKLAVDVETSMFDNLNGPLKAALVVVAALISIIGVVSTIISIYLAISYVKYNHRKNDCGLTGKDIARKILDDHGLQNVKVSKNGSLMFGNSYSHYFKKVRLRRLTWKKKSVASLAMASQKSCLAILDKEGDPDMRKRVKLVPIITFGPLAFIPLIVIGVILDFILFNGKGAVTIVFTILGLLFYVYSIVLSVNVLKTEVKAQKRAYQVLEEEKLATREELDMLEDLFRLYNIEYINDIILAVLELIYRVLQIFANARSNSSSSSNN